MSDIISELPEQFLREFREEVAATIPEEKVKQELAMVETAKALRAIGPMRTKEGLGQAVGSIPARIYFRFQNEFPGCWQDEEFVDAFLTDNPALCAPGYKPKQHSLRHGKTFVGGKPI